MMEVFLEKVLKWARGNDVCAMAVVEEVKDHPILEEHKELQ